MLQSFFLFFAVQGIVVPSIGIRMDGVVLIIGDVLKMTVRSSRRAPLQSRVQSLSQKIKRGQPR